MLVGVGALAEEGLDRVAALVRTGDERGALKEIQLLSEEARDEWLFGIVREVGDSIDRRP